MAGGGDGSFIHMMDSISNGEFSKKIYGTPDSPAKIYDVPAPVQQSNTQYVPQVIPQSIQNPLSPSSPTIQPSQSIPQPQSGLSFSQAYQPIAIAQSNSPQFDNLNQMLQNKG